MNAITPINPPRRPSFEVQISKISVGLGNANRQHQQVFAQAFVKVGPFRFIAYLSPDGSVCLPHELDHPNVIYEIKSQLRSLALEAAADYWALQTKRDADHLASCRANRRPLIGRSE